MNEFAGSVGLIRHPDLGEGHWLSNWDARRSEYTVVMADRLENESFRECLEREIAWTLELTRGKDYIISSVARIHFESVVQLTVPASREIPTVAEFFVADLYGTAAREKVDRNASVEWLTSGELLAGVTRGGRNVAPFVSALLRAADVIADNQNSSPG